MKEINCLIICYRYQLLFPKIVFEELILSCCDCYKH